MSISNKQENIRLEPVNAYWSVQQLTKIIALADVAGSLSGSYFDVHGKYRFWLDADNLGSAPAPGGLTLVEVDYSADDTAATIAAAIVAEAALLADLNASVDPTDSAIFYIQEKEVDAVAANSVDGDSGFTITTERTGADLPLGFLDGDVSFGLAVDMLDDASHQTGTQIVNSFITGKNLENITVTMKESDAVKLKQILEVTGQEFTPPGGTAISGWGRSGNFGSILADCRKLVLHPVRKPENELDGDFCFWRAYPMLSNINFSGESTRSLEVEFKLLPDGLLDERVELFVQGDHTQNFFK